VQSVTKGLNLGSRPLAIGRPAAGMISLAMACSAHALDFSDIAQEGELRFLAKHPEPNTYAYESHVDINAESLTTGIVGVSTCHRQLDPIRKVVIAFNPKRLIGLQVISHSGIEAVEAKGHHVTLTNVSRGANVCINLTSRALDRLDERGQDYQLHAGPLMRRYLDGYLPMQAKLNVHWPDGLLSLREAHPTSQPGVHLEQSSQGASLDLIFAGRFTGSFLLKRP
jgi:hypothetical protein